MLSLKPIILSTILGVVTFGTVLAQVDHCQMYAGILRKADSLSQAGSYVAAIKTYRAARVACPVKIYETDLRIERIVYRLIQMREQALQRRDELLQQMALLEKDLQRARYNEEAAEKKERIMRKIAEQDKQEGLQDPGTSPVFTTSSVAAKDPWDLLRTGHYQEALTLLEAAAFANPQDSLSLMRLAHANLFNGQIETAESIYRVLKPLPYRSANYNSFAEAYLKDFNALENAESALGNGQVIPLPVRDAYLRIRTDLENYAQALVLAAEEKTKSKIVATELAAEKTENMPPPSVAVETDLPGQDTSRQEQIETNENTEMVGENASNLEASTASKSGLKTRGATHSREKLEEDRPLPPAPDFVLKSLINTEIENKTTRAVNNPGEPSGYIVFIGDFDLNDYYAQRTLKRVRDQYGIQEARIRYFSEVLKYRVVVGEFSTKEEAAQYTLSFEQKYRERVWMGVLY
ncbi:hypothetical protein [Haliscomenobacter hydrossis]|uniref:Sporulation domain-containing protein n=1 Tax=Haliscomenobacter hydrossis (strain ATCC 27775 / DSM 1100 / LMG 10767 / O) TaxID=760192 RepID=F4KV20_HALH1|nr:hypothetical protein [Haliscomenobacter hydrossis]AEE49186.1 hypothetical protein Halhy_1291 [Haliscomenobacter hydrossis DSM 1100]